MNKLTALAGSDRAQPGGSSSGNIYDGVGTEHAAPSKGYSDFVQHTGPMISGQLRLVLNEPQTLRGSLRDAQTLRVTFGYSQTAHNSYRVEQSLCRRNSRVQIKQEQYSGSEAPMKSAGSRRDGADLLHEKGSAANAALWDDCFFNHEENQYSPVLDDNRLSLSELDQPFGSMPRDFSSFRITLLSQAEIDSSPSISIACFMAFSKPGSTLKAICLLPRGNFVFDICLTQCLSCLCLTMYNTFKAFVKQRSPEVLPTHSGLLTKPLYEVTIMADIKSTQTHPKFQYRFLAVSRSDRNAKPCRLSVEAYTEQEARRELAPHFILSLAARLPVQEVSHV